MRPASRVLFLVLLAALPAAAEDLTIVSKVAREGGPPQTATSYISNDKLRLASADGNEIIAEPALGKFTMIDHKKREYSVVTKQELEAMTAEMSARMKQREGQMKQAQEQLKNMPPEMREKMGGLMGGLAASVEVQKAPGGRTIAGYRCENWVVSVGTISRSEECLTTDLQLPLQAWDAYKDFAESMKGALGSMGPMGQGLATMKEKFKDMKGYPLATTTTTKFMGRSSSSSQEVTEVRKGPIPPSAWQIPAGYKQVASPMAKKK